MPARGGSTDGRPSWGRDFGPRRPPLGCFGKQKWGEGFLDCAHGRLLQAQPHRSVTVGRSPRLSEPVSLPEGVESQWDHRKHLCLLTEGRSDRDRSRPPLPRFTDGGTGARGVSPVLFHPSCSRFAIPASFLSGLSSPPPRLPRPFPAESDSTWGYDVGKTIRSPILY